MGPAPGAWAPCGRILPDEDAMRLRNSGVSMLTLISIQYEAGDYWLDKLYLDTFLCVQVDHSDEECRWVPYT